MKFRAVIILYCSLILSMGLLQSCDDTVDSEEPVGNWTITTPFKGSRRSSAIVFTIGDKAYAGMGYNGTDYLTDFFEFDPDLGYWQTKASFPGTGRERAVAFSIGEKAYVGLGYNRTLVTEELRDFWEYDPSTNEWTQLNDFGGSARYNAVAFSLGAKGYVATGNDGSNLNGDFWEYTPSTDTWKEIASYSGQKREEAMSFVVDGKVYVFGGRNNGLYNSDFFEFDQESNSWTSRAPNSDDDYYDDFNSAVKRSGGVAFTLNGKAYITTGINQNNSLDNSVWEYNPQNQVWDQKTSFEGSARSYAFSFVIKNRAFVGTGQNNSTRYDDIWEFKPDEEYDEEN